jgi:hypothetical protein
MKQYSTFVGMDVHKNSIEIAIAQRGRNGEVRNYGKIDGTLEALDKVVRKLARAARCILSTKPVPVGTRSIVILLLKDTTAR